MRFRSSFYPEKSASIYLPSPIRTAFHQASINFDHPSPIIPVPLAMMEAAPRAHSVPASDHGCAGAALVVETLPMDFP